MRILCFGDSNTYGYDPRDFFGGRYDAKDRWVDLLAGQTGHTVINAGVNGRRIPPCACTELLKKHAPLDIFLVMLGTNDLLEGASAEETASRMEVFLSQMLPYFPQILLVCPPPVKRGAWVDTDQLAAESCRLGERYHQLADRLNIPCVDTRRWNIALTFDGVHFTEAGNHTFAANLRKELQW